MAARNPTYIPAPNWDIPADSNTVVLGRFIKDPKDPESQVSRSGVKPISNVESGEKTDWKTTMEQLRSGKIGLWAKCARLLHLGGQMSFSKLKAVMERHEFETLETSYFVPDDGYLDEALQDRAVQGYLGVHEWRKPVYMITGLKIARGANVSTQKDKETTADAEIKVSAPEGTLGSGANYTSKDKRGVEYGGSTDYIFAYRLLRLRPKRGGEDFSKHTVVKGALFGQDQETDASERPLRQIFDVEYYEDGALGDPDSLEEIETDNNE